MLEQLRQRLRPGSSPSSERNAEQHDLPSSALVDLICPADLAPASARLDWARRVLTHYHGDAAASWPLLPWQGFGAQGVSAWRRDEAAAAEGAADIEDRPWARVDARWPKMLRALLLSRPALKRAQSARAVLLEAADVGHAVLTIAELRLGRLLALHRRRLDAPWPHSLQLWHRDQAGEPVQAVWLSGAGVAAAVPELVAAGLDVQAGTSTPVLSRPLWSQDFLRPQPRPSWLAWASLAAGGLVLTAAAVGTQQAWQQRAAAQAVSLPVAAAPRLKPAETLPTASALRLNHPWREVFLAAERPAVAGLSWLVLDHQAGGDLRLQGLSKTPEAVQRAATALRALPPWQRVLIARLEADEAALRFELTAQGPSLTP